MRDFADDLFFSSAVELNKRLRAREFSAAELTRAFLDRLERIGPKYNGLALSLRRTALKQASDVDGDLKIGRFRSPLQGIPFVVKDLLSVAKHPTTWGAKPFANQIFPYNAAVVDRLVNAGAILIGKVSMVELAGGGGYRFAAASLQGPGLNPWNPGRWSGGSSSGSGIAVAAGLAGFAIGSETSGSILTPSAYCGVTGLRPTYGLVSRFGAMALAWTMDKIGPMARTAADCGHILRAIAGSDDRDPSSAGKSFYYTPQYGRAWKDLTAAYDPVEFEAGHGEFRQALEVMRSTGMRLVERKLPDLPYGAVASTIVDCEGSAAFEELIESGRVDELADAKQIAGLKAGLEIPARDYLRAMRIRRVMQEALLKLFGDVDLVIAPTRGDVATPVEQALDAPRRKAPASPLIAASNLAGLPALSVPCGLVDGLPVGLQFVGRPFAENLVLAAGDYFQGKTDWHRRRPG